MTTEFKVGDKVETTTDITWILNNGSKSELPAKSLGTIISKFNDDGFVWVEYSDGYTRHTYKMWLTNLSEQKTTDKGHLMASHPSWTQNHPTLKGGTKVELNQDLWIGTTTIKKGSIGFITDEFGHIPTLGTVVVKYNLGTVGYTLATPVNLLDVIPTSPNITLTKTTNSSNTKSEKDRIWDAIRSVS